MVHRSILRMWKTGFHCRNRGFHSPESRFPVAGLKGTFQPEYSELKCSMLLKQLGINRAKITDAEFTTIINVFKKSNLLKSPRSPKRKKPGKG